MKSREELEIAMPGSSSWMPSAPQGVKGLDDDDFQTSRSANDCTAPFCVCSVKQVKPTVTAS